MEEAFEICDNVIIMDRGKKVLEGNPHQLITSHIEKYALQIIRKEQAKCFEDKLDSSITRKEESEEMVVYYTNDLKYLEKLAECMETGDFYIRQSNLEDLFLKTTGRSLNEDQ
jgi:lipooligosaccharide transport system ATP-binding protein